MIEDEWVGTADPVTPPSIDTSLVRRLVAAQFPDWADLPITPVEHGGWDNRTFHLGEQMTVRLPSAEGYTPQVDKEHVWLPVLAPHLPLPIPTPIARGVPGAGYPFGWSVYRWLDGENAHVGRIDSLTEFAERLGHFLAALQRIDPTGGPRAGAHSSFRGAPLQTYDADTRRAIEQLRGQIPAAAATATWEAAIAATWPGSPVWFHGDVSAGNLLVRDGKLAAVIDFGCCGVGDPACDMTIAWTLLVGREPGGVPVRARRGSRDLGTRSRLGVVEGADPARRPRRHRSRRGGHRPTGPRPGSRRPRAVRLTPPLPTW